jgi:hypothetical protein
MESPKNGCEALMTFFSCIKDVRGGRSIQYPLIEIIFPNVSSMLSGFSDLDEIVDFGEEKLG